MAALTWQLRINPDGGTRHHELAHEFWAVRAGPEDGGWWIGTRKEHDHMGEPATVRAMRVKLDEEKRLSRGENPRPEAQFNDDAPLRVRRWLFDPSGQPRVVITRQKNRQIVHCRGPGDSAWRRIGELNLLLPAWWPVQVDLQGRLWVTAEEGATREHALTTFDFDAGRPRQPALLATPGFDVGPGLVTARPGRRLLGVHTTSDATFSV